MNPTTRAILQTVTASDASLSGTERDLVKRLLTGDFSCGGMPAPADGERMLVTQKRAAELLSVNRVTIWRMTRDSLLHPVEILPGMWRYPFHEIARLARCGAPSAANAPRESLPAKIASAA